MLTSPNPLNLAYDHDEPGREYRVLLDDRQVGKLDYDLAGHIMTITHTETDPAVQGKGIAGQLTRHVLDEARRAGLRVVPECPYVRQFVERHPEYSDVL